MRDEYGGQFGLQLSGDEWRFFLVALLNAALVLIVALLAAMFAFVVFTTIAGGAVEGAGIDPEDAGFDLPMAMSYMGTADWVAAWAVNMVAFLLVAWLVARLSVSFPASFAQKAVRVLVGLDSERGSGLAYPGRHGDRRPPAHPGGSRAL